MTYHNVVVPIHGNQSDYRAIELAASVVTANNAELTLVYVVEVAQKLPLEAELPGEMDAGDNALQSAQQWARQLCNKQNAHITPELLQARSAGAAIVDEAIERGADLVVMALRNHKRHGRATVGETVPYVLKNAPCEVLVTRLPATNGIESCSWEPSEVTAQ